MHPLWGSNCLGVIGTNLLVLSVLYTIFFIFMIVTAKRRGQVFVHINIYLISYNK